MSLPATPPPLSDFLDNDAALLKKLMAEMPKGEEIEILDQDDGHSMDPEKMTLLTPEIMQYQATMNFGTIGHVAHGKSTLVRKLSGVHTVKFKNEQERNLTIKLGYANAKIYKCENPDCERPENYAPFPSSTQGKVPCVRKGCTGMMALERHISFVDCPGHDLLMATMLAGTSIMDAAFLLIAANEPCPQPQTCEHLAAVEVIGLKHFIVLQNKVELTSAEECREHHQAIVRFLSGTSAQHSPIVPISSIKGTNVDVVCEYICTTIPIPTRDFISPPILSVIRSFDVNQPGVSVSELTGGVAGGKLNCGILRVGDEIEIRPGIIKPMGPKKFECSPIRTKIRTLYTQDCRINIAVPGGLVGVGTTVDPSLTRSDRLVGHSIGKPGMMSDILCGFVIEFYLLKRMLGIVTQDQKGVRVSPLKVDEFLILTVGPSSIGSRVIAVNERVAEIELLSPIFASVGTQLALSRKYEQNWRLIGWGKIVKGQKVTVTDI